MAVDIAPRNASGAALGVVGIASYIGAGLQDVMSGVLIEGNKTVVNGADDLLILRISIGFGLGLQYYQSCLHYWFGMPGIKSMNRCYIN